MEITINKIAGSKNDFMEVNHIVLKGSNVDIGSKLAEIARTRHGINTLLHMNPQISDEHIKYIKNEFPILYKRMLGVANAYQVEINNQMCFSYLLYNMTIPACSTVYYPPNKTVSNHATVSRNYDFTTGTILGDVPGEEESPATSQPYVISMYPDKGYSSLFLCAYDILNGVIDGINSKGLVISIHGADELMRNNPIMPTFQPNVGLSELQLPRLILDTCATAEEAKECFLKNRKYFLASPLQYLVGDKSGQSYVLEPTFDKSPGKVVPNNCNYQILTNFMLTNYNSISDIPIGNDNQYYKMYSRYRSLYEKINGTQPPYDIDFIKATNQGVFFDKTIRDEINRSIFGKEDEKSSILDRTLWHSIYDCNEKNLKISFYLSDERRTDYLDFTL